VQHLDGSIIKELRVKEGDRLATGDVLVVLDDTQTRAEHHMPWQQFLLPHGTAERFRVELAQQPHLDETEGLKVLAHIRGKVTPP
jgi:membrane fusion protein, epimerase transport system